MIATNGTVYVDNTTLRAMARCDTESTLRHVLGYTVQEDAHALECGIAVHEVLADYMKGESAEFCLQKFSLFYEGYSGDHGLQDIKHPMFRLSHGNVEKCLAQYFDTHSLNSFPFSVDPDLVEVGFELPLSDECVCGHSETKHAGGGCQYRGRCDCTEYRPAFVMWGRLDAIVQAQHDNSLYVLDHKTTGRMSPFWSETFTNDSQMSGYVWAAGVTLGQPISGVFINGIELAKLPSDPVRKCKEHGVVYAECGILHGKSELLIYTRNQAQLEEWRQTAIGLARDYRNLIGRVKSIQDLPSVRTQGTFHGACGWCNFNKFCRAQRPIHYADSMLVHRPWRPYIHEETKAS